MTSYQFNDEVEEKTPAGMRGIGCSLIVILPIFSYISAVQLLKIRDVYLALYSISPSLFGAPSVHEWLWMVRSIYPFLHLYSSWTNLGANLLLGGIILVILSGIIALFYSIVLKAVSPSRYGPTDAPPSRRKVKKSR